MADVSVEFGATDTGLQKTLETIQRQMSSLQGEVDSGTLSFQEINQKMRELRQAEGIFTKLGGEVSEATKSAKEFENQIRLAEAVTKSNRTALEIYSEEVDKLGKLLDSGLISQKTYAAAIEKAEAALKAATPQTEEAKRANEELQAALKLAEQQTKAFAEEQKKAESITKSNRTALEIYSDEVDQLQKLLDSGLISQKTYAAAIEKAEAALKAATPQTEEAKRANEELEASLKKAEAETKALAEEQRKAEAITKANRSATEIYNQEIEELQKHLSGGRISMETFEKAVAKADAKLAAANPQVEELGKEIADAGNKSDKMGDQAGIGFGKLASAVGVGQLAAKAFTAALDAGFAAVRNTIQGFTDALDLGGTLSDLSSSTGESAGNLLLLQRAFDNTGAGAEKVGPSLAKLQNKIFEAGDGGKEATAAFGRLGLSMDDLAGKTPTEQLALVAQGIASIPDPSQRAATAIDIFGRSGAELLPLLTNFSGEMAEAGATVGSLADIMDRRANIFDSVGDRFLIIQQKVRDFAAGILDRALPALDAITTALSRIDAAAVGQSLADAFLGGQGAMTGFQAAVDAINIGRVGLAFEVFWESLKLQSMQTADSIYKSLVAAFSTAGDFISRIFDPKGTLMAYINGAFEMLGLKAAGALADALASALPDDLIFGGLKKGMSDFAKTAKEDSDILWGAMVHDVGYLKDQLSGAGASLPDSFKENYSKIPPLFDGIGAQQEKVAALEKKVEEAARNTNAERANSIAPLKLTGSLTEQMAAVEKALSEAIATGNTQLAEQLAKQKNILQNKLHAQELDQQAKAEKTRLIDLETRLNEALATGNTQLADSLKKEIETVKTKQEIAALTDKYVKELGVGKEEAAQMASKFVLAKNAAAGIASKDVAITVTTKVDDSKWRDLLASLNNTPDEKTIAIAMQVTGTTNLNDARKTLENMDRANKNFSAAFKVTGASSIEEVKNNLNSIPTQNQKSLAMKLTGKQDIDSAIKALDSVSPTKETKLALKEQGFDSIDDLQRALKGVPDQKRTDLILQALGIGSLEDANHAINGILRNNGKTTALTATADTQPAQAAFSALNNRAVTVQADANTAKIQTKLNALSGTPQNLDLNADSSISKIKSTLGEETDLALQSSKGTELLGDVKTLLDDIKGVMTTLSEKLPAPVLA